MKKCILSLTFFLASLTAYSHTVLDDVPEDARKDMKKIIAIEKKAKKGTPKENVYLIHCYKSNTETYADGPQASEYIEYSECSTAIPLPEDRSKIKSKEFKEFKKQWLKIQARVSKYSDIFEKTQSPEADKKREKAYKELLNLLDRYDKKLHFLYTGSLYPYEGC